MPELQTTLHNYYTDDFHLDIEEVLKYCDWNDISVLDYFIDGHSFDDALMPVIDRYEVCEDNGEVFAIDELLPNLYKEWAYHYFYCNDCPRLVVTNSDNSLDVINFWDDLNTKFNWCIEEQNTLMLDLLKTGKYQYIDMAANDSFVIEILNN